MKSQIQEGIYSVKPNHNLKWYSENIELLEINSSGPSADVSNICILFDGYQQSGACERWRTIEESIKRQGEAQKI